MKVEQNAICEFKKLFPELNTINEEEFNKEWHKNALELYEKYNKREISFERQKLKIQK